MYVRIFVDILELQGAVHFLMSSDDSASYTEETITNNSMYCE